MIPQDAVTALARHNFEESYRHLGWDELKDDVRAGWLRQAQGQCVAAAPFLRAKALEDAADLINAGGFEVPGNPYANTGLSDLALWHEVEDVLRARAATERGQR